MTTAAPDRTAVPPDPDPAAGAAPPPPPDALPIMALIKALQGELVEAVANRVHLIVLELRQAGVNAMQMVLLAVLAALMICGAWFTVMVAVYMALVHAAGLHWALALLVLMLMQIGAAGGIWVKAMTLSTALGFPATVRMLKNRTPDRNPTP